MNRQAKQYTLKESLMKEDLKKLAILGMAAGALIATQSASAELSSPSSATLLSANGCQGGCGHGGTPSGQPKPYNQGTQPEEVQQGGHSCAHNNAPNGGNSNGCQGAKKANGNKYACGECSGSKEDGEFLASESREDEFLASESKEEGEFLASESKEDEFFASESREEGEFLASESKEEGEFLASESKEDEFFA